jgi:hypothetical protein
VEAESGGYVEPENQDQHMNQHYLSPDGKRLLETPSALIQPPAAKSPMLQEVFNLDEGPVTVLYPSLLSPESYDDLDAQLQLFLRRAKRRSEFQFKKGESE